MDKWRSWYDSLKKPRWTPKPAVISIIWTILYPIIFITYAFVFYKVFNRQVPTGILTPFIINLITNLSFTPILFKLKNLKLALLDIAVVWITIVWSMLAIFPYFKWVSLAQIPYLAWVTTASTLQIFITLKNT